MKSDDKKAVSPHDKMASELTVLRRTQFSGPIPSPEVLAKYADIDQGIPNRIVTMAESRQQQRHKTETKLLNSAVKMTAMGKTHAFIIVLTIILGSIFLIATGKEVYGMALVVGATISIASMFLGRKKDK